MKITTLHILGSSMLILLIMGAKKTFGKLKKNQKIRGCDAFGCGYFNAPRGTRKHKGIDVITVNNEDILSPINGKVTRYPFPYQDDLSYTGIQIENELYLVKMFYLRPTVAIGSTVLVGQKIGVSQEISQKYDSTMTNHVHFESYKKIRNNWVLINPTNLF